MTTDRPVDRVVRIVVKNGTRVPARLVLKPFSGFYDMAVGESYEVRAYGPSMGTITIEQVEGGCVVTGWPDCILSAHTLKQLGGQRLRVLPLAVAPTIALLRRMLSKRRGHDDVDDGDDEDTLV
jgi:hypothetical protein